MQIQTNATDRKNLVKVIARYTGEHPIYLGPPTFVYQVGEYTVSRDAVITTENEEKGAELLAMLREEGLVTEDRETTEVLTADIQIPLTDFTARGVINLVNMIYAKQYLINRSLGKERIKIDDALVTALADSEYASAEDAMNFIMAFSPRVKGIAFADGCISFLDFPSEADRVSAYMELTAAMVGVAKKAGSVKAKVTIEENEKFYMRTWLIRIGLGGKEKKDARQILLKNLKGHTAFRTEADQEKWKARQKVRRAEREESDE